MFKKAKNKRFLISIILVVVLVGIFTPHVAYAGSLLDALATFIAKVLLLLSSVVLALGGLLFDGVVKFTVVEMAEHIGDGTAIGDAIDISWTSLRDIANMVFIFVLLYAAFKAMFSLNISSIGPTVKNIIIIALLINFSLFFSKVVIDASNIISVGFYNEIAEESFELDVGFLGDLELEGITPGYMKMLGIQSVFGSDMLASLKGPVKIVVYGIMGSALFFVTAFVLFITAAMFITRFILLIFIMILSPLAFIAFIIPGFKNQFTTWRQALINQSFFAPIYFALTWVVFSVGTAVRDRLATGGELSTITEDPAGSLGIFVSFTILIGFTIASLILSKQIAAKTAGFTAITKRIGGGTAGTLGWAGRGSFGWLGAKFAESARLQKAAAEKKGFRGAGARLALYGSKKARDATWDVRNAAIPTSAIGDAIKGTAGRTRWGKAIGLDDVNIKSMQVTKPLAGGIIGEGGDKGYAQAKEESRKRVAQREAEAEKELHLAEARRDVKVGSDDKKATAQQVEKMQEALAKLSDKETEALVASNRKLLESQNFANAISVKQLEALNKSEQFSDSEKSSLIKYRFKDIERDLAIARGGATLPRETINKIKGLSNSELEMVDPDYLENPDFVEQVRSSQVENILKSDKFTRTQKDSLKNARVQPLKNALAAGNLPLARAAASRIGHKEIATLDMNTAELLNPTMLQVYTPQMLTRLVGEMKPTDVSALRAEILRPGAGDPATVSWLNTPQGLAFS